MNANLILLQKKYSRVVELFAVKACITISRSLDFFYRSELYQLVREGVSDLHCMSDDYLADDLLTEYNEQQAV
jgi:hypothetical protein